LSQQYDIKLSLQQKLIDEDNPNPTVKHRSPEQVFEAIQQAQLQELDSISEMRSSLLIHLKQFQSDSQIIKSAV